MYYTEGTIYGYIWMLFGYIHKNQVAMNQKLEFANLRQVVRKVHFLVFHLIRVAGEGSRLHFFVFSITGKPCRQFGIH